MLEQWVKNLRREGFAPTATSFVCGTHFLPDMFAESTSDGRRCLKVVAVPTGSYSYSVLFFLLSYS